MLIKRVQGWLLKRWIAILRRRQYTSLSLRRIFKSRFDVAVGLYSYGCFDQWRIVGPTTIGRYCSFAGSAQIIRANHPWTSLSTHPYFYEAKWDVVQKDRVVSRPLIIEDDVWVGHNATILPGCCFVGRGSIIAAGSVVTSDVPQYSVVAGVPAKIIKVRFASSIIEMLEATKWWELSKNELAKMVERLDQNIEISNVADADRVLRALLKRKDHLI